MRGETDLRPLLFSIAYRMLGSVGDAEDLVQEALLRLKRARRAGEQIASAKAFLTTIVARLAIDELRSARVKRETYIGPWLSEPLLTAPDPGPAEVAEMADSLSLSFLVLLETLSEVERAVFLMREVFGYGYDEIATIVDRSEVNCRQIRTRARPTHRRGQAAVCRRPGRAAGARGFVHRGAPGRQRGARAGDARSGRRLLRRRRWHRTRPAAADLRERPGVAASRRIRPGGHQAHRADRGRADHRPTRHAQLRRRGAPHQRVLIRDLRWGITSIRSIINPDKLSHLGYPLSPVARRSD